MADISVNGSAVGNSLQQLLMCNEIAPGSAPSYETCKTILSYHPLGLKLTDTPLKMAQSKKRKITVQTGPENDLVEAFEAEWKKLGSTRHIRSLGRQARAYGIASIALVCDGDDSSKPLDLTKIWDKPIAFNVFDPLNTAGSLVLNQDPNSVDFQKVIDIAVGSTSYHRSRTCVLLNEEPLYIEYTSSAFGYVGRSVYQRPLFPLKTYIQSMITDDMIVVKSGVLIAKIKAPGAIINQVMQGVNAIKRSFVKEATTNSVINITPDEEIETLNMQNLEGPYSVARTNVLENVATGADMPATIIKAETFAQGFGEGTEDAKHVAQYLDGIREWLEAAYDYFDTITMYRAWNPEFYKLIQRKYPEQYAEVGYAQAFYEWRNSFRKEWPSLLEEPDSDKIKVEEVKLRAVIAAVEVTIPLLDPDNKAKVIQWLCDSFNELDMMFGSRLDLDFDLLLEHLHSQPALGEGPGGAEEEEPRPPRPFAADSVDLSAFSEAIARLPVSDAVRRQARKRGGLG